MKMLEKFTHEALTAVLHTAFKVYGRGETVEMQLVEVSPLKKTPRTESFSLTFQAPVDAPLGQGNYPIEHAQLGQAELFIVPVKQEGGHLFYQAVFNRLVAGK
jgi:hypothetical protein